MAFVSQENLNGLKQVEHQCLDCSLLVSYRHDGVLFHNISIPGQSCMCVWLRPCLSLCLCRCPCASVCVLCLSPCLSLPLSLCVCLCLCLCFSMSVSVFVSVSIPLSLPLSLCLCASVSFFSLSLSLCAAVLPVCVLSSHVDCLCVVRSRRSVCAALVSIYVLCSSIHLFVLHCLLLCMPHCEPLCMPLCRSFVRCIVPSICMCGTVFFWVNSLRLPLCHPSMCCAVRTSAYFTHSITP